MRADFHVHSAFSDDSSYPIEEVCRDACRLGLDAICITDHVDYGVKPDVSPIDTAGTIFDESYVADPTSITANVYGEREVNVDYQHYFPALYEMRERFARPDHDWWGGTVAVYCGLELGIQRHTIDQNARLVTAHKDELDFVLLSCHQIDNLEFWQGDYQRGRQPEQITQAYYEELYACQRSFHDYSCLAHLDAIKRDNPGDRRPFAAYRDLVAAILEQAIADGKGIELNTSSVRYGLSDWQPCKEIVALYRDLGGTLITLGSDSHQPEHLGSYLREAADFLYALGFDGISTFDHLEPQLHRF